MAGAQTHKFHEVVIDFSSSALHDEDILSANGLADFDPRLANCKLGELGNSQLHALGLRADRLRGSYQPLCWRDAEVVAYLLCSDVRRAAGAVGEEELYG